jgi:ABC-type uncharacterized transport system substrate-binding protein
MRPPFGARESASNTRSTSPGSRTAASIGAIEKDGAAASTGRKNRSANGALCGLKKTATRVTRGAVCLSTSGEINAAFASLGRERPDALFVGGDAFFNTRRVHLVNLASRHALPAAYAERVFPEIGGLMSYGTDIVDAYRQLGIYAGRILKGAKPADLPVVQSSKFELVINAETARMLGLAVPPMLLARADEVIE